MQDYLQWAFHASSVLKDVFTTWYVWWPMGLLVWFLFLRVYAMGDNEYFGGTFGAAAVGSVVGACFAIVLPVIIITSPFWLPLFSAAALVILAGVLVNKLLEKK